MRIGIVCPYNLFRPGGVQEHIYAQAAELRKRGHKVIIITPKPRGAAVKPGKDVYFIGQSVKMRAQSSTVDLSAPIDEMVIEEMYDELKLDVIHFHEAFVPFIPRQMVLQAKCPTVGTLHAAIPETLLGRSVASIRPYMRSVLSGLDAITAVSPAAVLHVQDMLSKEINYIPNGIAEDYKMKSNASKRDSATILFVGRLEKRKGAKYLIDAFELVAQEIPEAKCVIAGDGQLRKTLERYAKDRGIDNVSFVGYIDDKKKKELMSSCSVYTSPAIYGESFGIVLLEAMKLGAPIVAHPNQGYEWVMKGMGRLSLVDVKNPEEYARRLILMIQESKLREAWQAWAKEYVKQFSYTYIVDEYEKLYKKLVKANKKS